MFNESPDNGDEVMTLYGLGERNAEGQMIVHFSKLMEMPGGNMCFKEGEHSITCIYRNEGKSTQIDSILCRKCSVKIH